MFVLSVWHGKASQPSITHISFMSQTRSTINVAHLSLLNALNEKIPVDVSQQGLFVLGAWQ